MLVEFRGFVVVKKTVTDIDIQAEPTQTYDISIKRNFKVQLPVLFFNQRGQFIPKIHR